MNSLQQFKYNGFTIEFELIDGELYANATAMCQAFNKRPIDWMRLPATVRYADAQKAKCENLTSLTISRRGGLDGGSTWIHEKLILKLAQWLDVEFEIWCDDRVSDVIKGRNTIQLSTRNLPSYQIENPIERAKQWILEQKEKQALVFENADLKLRAEYADQVLLSETKLTTTKVAQNLGMTAQALNKILKERGVQYKRSGIWNLTTAYNGKGYAKLRTLPYFTKDGTAASNHLLVWTETGRQFIHSLLSPPMSLTTSIPQQSALA